MDIDVSMVTNEVTNFLSMEVFSLAVLTSISWFFSPLSASCKHWFEARLGFFTFIHFLVTTSLFCYYFTTLVHFMYTSLSYSIVTSYHNGVSRTLHMMLQWNSAVWTMSTPPGGEVGNMVTADLIKAGPGLFQCESLVCVVCKSSDFRSSDPVVFNISNRRWRPMTWLKDRLRFHSPNLIFRTNDPTCKQYTLPVVIHEHTRTGVFRRTWKIVGHYSFVCGIKRWFCQRLLKALSFLLPDCFLCLSEAFAWD